MTRTQITIVLWNGQKHPPIWPIRFMLLGIIWLAATCAEGQTNYFVASGGSDASNGTSPATAWATIHYGANQLNPGDVLTVQEGTYDGFRMERSGTISAPIVIYAQPGDTVILNHINQISSPRNCIIEIETWSGDGTVSNVVVEGFQVDNSPRYGIWTLGTAFCVVRGNTVSGSASSGIFTSFSYDLLIEDNTSYGNGEHGIYFNNSGDRFAIRRNMLFGNANCGLHMNADASIIDDPVRDDGMISDGIVEANMIYANIAGGSGINMDGVEGAVVRNNLIFSTPNNSGIALFKADGAYASRNNLILNNTVLMSTTGGWGINLTAGAVSNRVFNNIIYSAHSWRGAISLASSAQAGFQSDGNVLENGFSADGGDTKENITTWRARGYDLNSTLTASPDLLFENVSQTNYHLQASSLAIDVAIDLPSVARDRDRVPRPLDGLNNRTARWDAGCYEFVNATADTDGDAMRDTAELYAGTNPTNSSDFLAVHITAASNQVVLTWPSAEGRSYTIKAISMLGYNGANLRTNITADPPINSISIDRVQPSVFYSLTVE